MSSDSKPKFPKFLFKRGTGKAVGETGFFTAESVMVSSQAQVDALEGDWCETPVEAATPVSAPKKEPAAVHDFADEPVKHHKKVK